MWVQWMLQQKNKECLKLIDVSCVNRVTYKMLRANIYIYIVLIFTSGHCQNNVLSCFELSGQ